MVFLTGKHIHSKGRGETAQLVCTLFFKGESLRYVLFSLYVLPHLHVILCLYFLVYFVCTLNHNRGGSPSVVDTFVHVQLINVSNRGGSAWDHELLNHCFILNAE